MPATNKWETAQESRWGRQAAHSTAISRANYLSWVTLRWVRSQENLNESWSTRSSLSQQVPQPPVSSRKTSLSQSRMAASTEPQLSPPTPRSPLLPRAPRQTGSNSLAPSRGGLMPRLSSRSISIRIQDQAHMPGKRTRATLRAKAKEGCLMGLYLRRRGFIKNQECWPVIQTFWLDPVSMIHRGHNIIFKDQSWIQRVSLVFHLMKRIHWITSSQSQSTFISSNQTQVLVIMIQNQYRKIHKVHNMFSNQ